MAEAPAPDYVVVGHITHDLLPGGTYRVGGTATYSAVTAARLGCWVGVLTSSLPQDAAEAWRSPVVRDIADAVTVECVPAAHTTTFENRYVGLQREQYVRHVAAPLGAADLPASWRGAPILHLGPVAAEVAEGCWQEAGARLLGATPQGWMRRWGDDGRVWPSAWRNAQAYGPCADALVLSIEDLGYNEAAVRALAGLVSLLVVTTGPTGATVYRRDSVQQVPAFESREVDLTGAGDVFAAAFFVATSRGAGSFDAALLANAAASLAIEAPGLEGIPDGPAIERRLRRGRPRS